MIINKSLGYEDAAIRSIHKLVENEQKELLSSNYPSKVYTCESLELILQYNLLIDVLLSYPFCTSFNHQEKILNQHPITICEGAMIRQFDPNVKSIKCIFFKIT